MDSVTLIDNSDIFLSVTLGPEGHKITQEQMLLMVLDALTDENATNIDLSI
jgi:hypothetical protein